MELFQAVIEESLETIDHAHGRIIHCLDQLNEAQVWHKPGDTVNSVGIILQHLAGNLRQWLVGGVGGAPDVRDRPAEFRDDAQPAKAELMGRLREVIDEGKEAIRGLKPDEILAERRIQGFDETALSALWSAIPHLELHAGQISYITHLLLGSRYELRWRPQNPAQGAG